MPKNTISIDVFDCILSSNFRQKNIKLTTLKRKRKVECSEMSSYLL